MQSAHNDNTAPYAIIMTIISAHSLRFGVSFSQNGATTQELHSPPLPVWSSPNFQTWPDIPDNPDLVAIVIPIFAAAFRTELPGGYACTRVWLGTQMSVVECWAIGEIFVFSTGFQEGEPGVCAERVAGTVDYCRTHCKETASE